MLRLILCAMVMFTSGRPAFAEIHFTFDATTETGIEWIYQHIKDKGKVVFGSRREGECLLFNLKALEQPSSRLLPFEATCELPQLTALKGYIYDKREVRITSFIVLNTGQEPIDPNYQAVAVALGNSIRNFVARERTVSTVKPSVRAEEFPI
jgi:hypothetical protein